MRSQLKVLCVHGISHVERSAHWLAAWETAVLQEVARLNPACTVEVRGVDYDALFAERPLGPAQYAEALWRLGSSWVHTGVLDLFRTRRGLQDVPDLLRWTAGMVAQWTDDAGLRAELRARLAAAVAEHRPDVILAHSLGSLICYDAFSERGTGPALAAGRTLVTFGSQIGHPAVRATFGGRIQPLPSAACWFHLVNELDRAFTAEIAVNAPNFRQIRTRSDLYGPLHHDVEGYLHHSGAQASLWPALLQAEGPVRAAQPWQAFREAVRPPDHRALLAGINDYPRPEMRLGGCVNDVFLMSAALQECGFRPQEIRVVLDERATADALRERLRWLLDDTRPGDYRVFFYSGHGAQLPAYGVRDEVDHLDECLVPYDFDWSQERAITDDELFELYSQLPYDSQFVTILDCCHSGGMTRASGRSARGIDPPDDIRHRMLAWDPERQVWRERPLPEANRSLSDQDKAAARAWVGESGAKRRLGRAVALRTLDDREYDAVRDEKDHSGPYLPMVLEACQEGQLAYEYRHGVTSYGAFTFLLTSTLGRIRREEGRNPNYEELLAAVNAAMRELGYEQNPALLGPQVVRSAPIPWGYAPEGTGAARQPPDLGE